MMIESIFHELSEPVEKRRWTDEQMLALLRFYDPERALRINEERHASDRVGHTDMRAPTARVEWKLWVYAVRILLVMGAIYSMTHAVWWVFGVTLAIWLATERM